VPLCRCFFLLLATTAAIHVIIEVVNVIGIIVIISSIHILLSFVIFAIVIVAVVTFEILVVVICTLLLSFLFPLPNTFSGGGTEVTPLSLLVGTN
jgi:hypothetical protein